MYKNRLKGREVGIIGRCVNTYYIDSVAFIPVWNINILQRESSKMYEQATNPDDHYWNMSGYRTLLTIITYRARYRVKKYPKTLSNNMSA